MSVATSYAKALYESSKEAGASGEVLGQLENQLAGLVAGIESSNEAKVALYSPITTVKEKSAIIEAICQKQSLTTPLTQFVVLLARKGRLKLLPLIRDALVTVRLSREGGLPGALVSAEPMSKTDVEGLAKAFGQKLGKRVVFQVSTDATLLAGVRVTVNGVTYDGTLRSQLQRLRDRLVSGATAS